MQESRLKTITDRIYGGLKMSWLNVILFAQYTAVLTVIFLIFPVFEKTSFHRMGVTFEAWIFFAVMIMANCRTPLDSALKTFVFFLISQPLIYLLQVPFSSMGWGLFGYYKTWFLWTAATLPMAYIGWYIRKKNMLSVLILLPACWLLAADSLECFAFALRHFPYLLFTAVFCLIQVLVYAYVFTSDLKQKAAVILIPFAIAAGIMFMKPQLDVRGNMFLPDHAKFSENAVIETEGLEGLEIKLQVYEDESMIDIRATKYGTAVMSVTDGDDTYRYSVTVYEDDEGHTQIDIAALP